MPLEAINKELSRHESDSQQAIIMELSCEESCCSAGNNQAAEQAGIIFEFDIMDFYHCKVFLHFLKYKKIFKPKIQIHLFSFGNV